MNFFLKHLVEPVIHRIGTYVGGFLSAQNLASDDISTVMAAVPILVGLIADIVIRQVKL